MQNKILHNRDRIPLTTVLFITIYGEIKGNTMKCNSLIISHVI